MSAGPPAPLSFGRWFVSSDSVDARIHPPAADLARWPLTRRRGCHLRADEPTRLDPAVVAVVWEQQQPWRLVGGW